MENLDFNRIHKYHQDDLDILIDINSGSLHLIDKITWDFLDFLEEKDWQGAKEALAEKYSAADLCAQLYFRHRSVWYGADVSVSGGPHQSGAGD